MVRYGRGSLCYGRDILVLSPYNVYRDRYKLMKTVQIWTVRFHEISIKFATFSKVF